ncbi:MAG: hypothetical protein R2771_08520 [Saprospiraceae bacterium]
MGYLRYYIFAFFIGLVLISCHDNDNNKTEYQFDKGKGIFISNEGVFSQANASVDFYNFDNDSIYNDIFYNTNKDKIGDVLQSICQDGDYSYLVVNNSGIIHKVSTKDFVRSDTITGFTSPRKMIKINDSKAYVSDLYSGKIYIVSLTENKISGEIQTGQWVENFASNGNKVYASCPTEYGKPESTKILVIDSNTDKITDSIAVGFNPMNLAIDKNGYLWTLCNGNSYSNINGSIYKTDLNSLTNIDSLTFDSPLSNYNTSLQINSTEDTIYFLYNDVSKLSVNSSSMQPEKVVEKTAQNFYGMNIDDNRNNIYVTEAPFTGKGNVYIYSKSGILKKTLQAGYYPNSVVVY